MNTSQKGSVAEPAVQQVQCRPSLSVERILKSLAVAGLVVAGLVVDCWLLVVIVLGSLLVVVLVDGAAVVELRLLVVLLVAIVTKVVGIDSVDGRVGPGEGEVSGGVGPPDLLSPVDRRVVLGELETVRDVNDVSVTLFVEGIAVLGLFIVGGVDDTGFVSGLLVVGSSVVGNVGSAD